MSMNTRSSLLLSACRSSLRSLRQSLLCVSRGDCRWFGESPPPTSGVSVGGDSVGAVKPHLFFSDEVELCKACLGRNLETVRFYLDHERVSLVSVGINDDGISSAPLFCSAYGGHEKIVSLLLERGADPHLPFHQRNPVKSHMLHEAFPGALPVTGTRASGDRAEWQRMIASDRSEFGEGTVASKASGFSHIDTNGWTPVSVAAYFGRIGAIKLLTCRTLKSTDEGTVAPLADLPDASGATPLMHACERGHTSVVKYLVNVRACNVNHVCKQGQSPLMAAARGGNVDCVRFLLENTAVDVQRRGFSGETALTWAVRSGGSAVTQLFLRLLPRMFEDSVTNDGNTLLHHAVLSRNQSILSLLVHARVVNVDARNRFGQTALHDAIERGYEPMARILAVDGGASASVLDKQGHSALDIATM